MMIQSDFHIFQGGWNHQLDENIPHLSIFRSGISTGFP